MSIKVIDKSQVKDAIKVKGPVGTAIAAIAMYLTGFNKINKIYSHISEYEGCEFAQKLIEYLNVKCDINEEELEYIPKSGPFIIVSNHPYGAIDGMIMLSVIGKIRPDFKILTNFILSHIPNLSTNFFPVNPFTDKPGLKSSLKGLKLAKEHLENGGALGLFPAGEVSSNSNKEKIVKDIPWQLSIIKLIKNSGVPVVPVYFEGQNSAFFHFLGKIHPILRTVRLPHELANKKDKTISLRIGRPILTSEIEEFTSLNALGEYLWNRTYALEGNVRYYSENKESHEEHSGDAAKWVKFIPFAEQKGDIPTIDIMKAIDKNILTEEINNNISNKLYEIGPYQVFLSDYENIPNMIKEIGIRREEAFRAVGEGTGKEIDLDEYDKYYKHLYIWDSTTKSLVGAYRLAVGNEVLKQFGIEGLYSNSLFRYKKEFIPYLEKTVELGRSFVNPAYQKEALPLMLLIKGLFYSMLKYPNTKYLVGPVSISSWYPMFYRSLMIYYLNNKHIASQFTNMISPLMPFTPDYKRINVEALLLGKMDSVEKFDRFIYRLSNNEYRLPTLLKKYLKMNARIIGFNVDPDFNYCVDGLMILDLGEIPRQEIDSLSKEFGEDKSKIYSRFEI